MPYNTPAFLFLIIAEIYRYYYVYNSTFITFVVLRTFAQKQHIQDYTRCAIYAMIEAMSQSDKNNKEELYALVHGQVQGVGFRYFVSHRALSLGLRGYARNKGDGNVEVVAQGTRNSLEALLALLRQGPSAAEVDDVETIWREPTEHFSGFSIRW